MFPRRSADNRGMLGIRTKKPLTLGLSGPGRHQAPPPKATEGEPPPGESAQPQAAPPPGPAPVAPAPAAAHAGAFPFGQSAAPVEIFVDPSLLNLVERTSNRYGVKPEQAKPEQARPEQTGKLDSSANQIRFRTLNPTNIRIPVPDGLSTPPPDTWPTNRSDKNDKKDEWAATPPGASAPHGAPPRHTSPQASSFNIPRPNSAEAKNSSRPDVSGPSTSSPRPPAPQIPLRRPNQQTQKYPDQKPVEQKIAETSSYEIVLGRRQIAGLLFMVTALMMLSASAAYLVGKSAGRKNVVAVVPFPPKPPVRAEPLAAPVVPVATPAPIVSASPPVAKPVSPIFGNPVRGKSYLQVTAVEKGMAEVIAQGFRARGLDSFAAPTPSPKVFRVLIGPLADQASYLRAKDTVDDLGLSATARRFQE